MDEETHKKIHELQELEHSIQSLLMEKQNFQIELSEVSNALSEVESTSEDVYKLLSGMLIKSEKSKVLKELNDKKKTFELRISAIEKNEKTIVDRIEKLRKEVQSFH